VLDVVINGTRLGDEDIYSQLRLIVETVNERGEEGSELMERDTARVGVLTGATRDCWAGARLRLIQGNNNFFRHAFNILLLHRCNLYRFGYIYDSQDQNCFKEMM